MSVVERAAILHLSAASPQSGAGGAALATHLALRKRGIHSKMLFLAGVHDDSLGLYSFADNACRKSLRLAITTLDRLVPVAYRKRIQLYSPGLFGQRLTKHPLVRAADLIHLNWVNHGFVDVAELQELKKPIVWTMHDMWPFTGGCHHSMGCTKYRQRCGACPVLGSNREEDLSARVHRRKIHALSAVGVSWVGVSAWMAEQARSSAVLRGQAVHVIHSGIDTERFQPCNRASARDELNLPQHQRLVLLGAHDLHSPFKGVGYSIEALGSLNPDYTVVTFGRGSLSPGTLRQPVIDLGFIADPRRMALAYSAADVFLATSVAEAFGKTLAEAQCCGTPVVAFNSTGPRDIVEHGVTGYLAAAFDASDVAAGIEYCLTRAFDRAAIRARAERFSIAHCTEQYVNLYERLLSRAW